MEGFEQFVAVALESEHYVVSSAVKFRVERPTRKKGRSEVQAHGYEVDLVAARSDRLILATVKSFFGSRGVVADDVVGLGGSAALYKLLNDEALRWAVIRAACEEYGYKESQVNVRLYVGKFAGPTKGEDEARIKEWCASQRAGGGSIEVRSAQDVVGQVRRVASQRQYRNNPVIVALKVLDAAGALIDLTDTPKHE